MPYLSEEHRLDMASPDQVSKNLEALAALFPNCITETENGKAVDFDLLKQELSHQVIEGNKERYRLEWPGKREAIVTANLPTTKTLRPVREDSVNFDETENLYIEGDNLEVLKLLQESYFGKIKMIYIDPPYNTGNDFVYKDNFAQATDEFKQESGLVDEQDQRLVANPETSGRYHSDWLSMIYPRVKLSRNLLSQDGVICISIDDNEIHNLREICNEIFGEGSFLGTFVWKRRENTDSRNQSNISVDHEYILAYGRTTYSQFLGRKIDINKYQNPDNDPRGPWASTNLSGLATADQRPNLHYDIIDPNTGHAYPPNPKRGWSKSKRVVEQMILEGRILFPKNISGRPREKKFLDDLRKDITGFSTYLNSDLVGFTTNGTRELTSIFDGKLFDFPKSRNLIKEILQQTTSGNDIVLDFFSGSATTAHSVMHLNAEDAGNRKFIMVQLPEVTDEKSEAYKAGYENICEIGKERIRRAGKKLGEELAQKKSAELNFSGQEPKQLDTGFRVYRLDSSNMQDVYYRPQDYQQDQLDIFADNIKPDRTADDLLAQVMLDWGLPLSYTIEQLRVLDKKVFRVAQDSLLACFDKGIDEAFAREISSYKPLRIVFRDQSFKDDTAKENVRQLLKQLSPDTEMRVI